MNCSIHIFHFKGSDSNSADLSLVKQELGEGEEEEGIPRFDRFLALVAGAWTEREKMYHGGSFLKLADDDMDIQNPEAQNRELGGF